MWILCVIINKYRTSVSSEPFVLLTSKVAAAPTTVAAIATEAAVSGKAEDTVGNFLSCSSDFMSIEEKALPCNPVQTLSFKSLVTSQHQGKDQPEQPPSHNSVFWICYIVRYKNNNNNNIRKAHRPIPYTQTQVQLLERKITYSNGHVKKSIHP